MFSQNLFVFLKVKLGKTTFCDEFQSQSQTVNNPATPFFFSFFFHMINVDIISLSKGKKLAVRDATVTLIGEGKCHTLLFGSRSRPYQHDELHWHPSYLNDCPSPHLPFPSPLFFFFQPLALSLQPPTVQTSRAAFSQSVCAYSELSNFILQTCNFWVLVYKLQASKDVLSL